MKKCGSVCVFALIFISSVIADVDPEEYLSTYGYLPFSPGKPNPKTLRKAILKFQSLMELPKTGKIDNATLNIMRAPRCNVQDIYPNEYRARPNRNRTLITWQITQYGGQPYLSFDQQRDAIDRGFKLWASVTPLVIQETKSEPTVDVRFVKDKHEHNLPMYKLSTSLAHARPLPHGAIHFNDEKVWDYDGKKGHNLLIVAAHEFGHVLGLTHTVFTNAIMGPIYNSLSFKLHPNDVARIQNLYGTSLAHARPLPHGAIHFNDEKVWDYDGKKGHNLLIVAAHEFGHVLGLTHTVFTNAIMGPIYNSLSFKLHPNDVARIQNLYGKKPIGDAHFCNFSYKSLDAAMRINETDFVFVDEGQVINGRTGKKMAVQRLFPGGPDWVQAAAYSKQYSKAYLFKGDKIWAYTLSSNWQFSLVENYPKPNLVKYSHSPECAMRHNLDEENIILIKNGYIFKFLPYFEYVAPGDLVYVSEYFHDVPSKLDAAISSDNNITFITEKQAFQMKNPMRAENPRGVPSYRAFNNCPSLNNF